MTLFRAPENKQPWERMDYAITFQDWLNGGDYVFVAEAFVECLTDPTNTSLEVDLVEYTRDTVKVWVQGGTHNHKYKITIRTTTSQERRDESELVITVKEV